MVEGVPMMLLLMLITSISSAVWSTEGCGSGEVKWCGGCGGVKWCGGCSGVKWCRGCGGVKWCGGCSELEVVVG